MTKKSKLNLIAATIFSSLTLPLFMNGGIFAENMPITPPITVPITAPIYTATPTATATAIPTSVPTPTPTATSTPVQYSLQIINPNGGENIQRGELYTIQWNSSHNFSDISLYYAVSGGFSGSIASHISDTGSFIWQANPIYGNGQYKIFINGDIGEYNYANDSSDSYFNVVPAASATPVVTMAPTSTPTASATPTSTPVVTSTPTMSPTATPVVNSAPIFSTSSIPALKTKKVSTFVVSGFDINKNDILTISDSGLPTGLRKSCISYVSGSKKMIQCTYTGIITKVGIYRPIFTIKDNYGSTIQRTFTMIVFPR